MAISTEELTSLDQVQALGQGADILSVYLALEPSRNVDYAHLPEMTRLVREARGTVDEQALTGFEAEAERCLDFVRGTFQPSGRTLLLFSSMPRGLWVTLQVQAELPSRAHYGPRPYLLPLLAEPALERRAIVTIDQKGASLITTRLGEVESEASIQDYVPRSSRKRGRKHQDTGANRASGSRWGERAGGTPSFNEDQSLDEWVLEHYRNVRDALEELQEASPFERLAVGGTGENAARLIEMLPEGLRSRVAGTFPVDAGIAAHEVAREAQPVFADRRAAEERQAIESAQDLARAGGAATLGWEDTLSALQQGRVMRLLVSQDAAVNGLACDAGHYIGVEAAKCPVCGAELQEVHDLPHAAAQLAFDTGAQVSYVSSPAAEDLADSAGVAALLRY